MIPCSDIFLRTTIIQGSHTTIMEQQTNPTDSVPSVPGYPSIALTTMASFVGNLQANLALPPEHSDVLVSDCTESQPEVSDTAPQSNVTSRSGPATSKSDDKSQRYTSTLRFKETNGYEVDFSRGKNPKGRAMVDMDQTLREQSLVAAATTLRQSLRNASRGRSRPFISNSDFKTRAQDFESDMRRKKDWKDLSVIDTWDRKEKGDRWLYMAVTLEDAPQKNPLWWNWFGQGVETKD